MKNGTDKAAIGADRAQKRLVALFFVILFSIGFLTLDDYGSAWDDTGEMNILRMALKEYAIVIPISTRAGQAYIDMDLPRISESIERDHGICAYYPLFWAFASDDMDIREQTALWRMQTWVIFILGLFALYSVCRHIRFNRAISCLCVLFVVLSPRFFAEGHYNSKDIVLMSLSLVTFWQAARLIAKQNLRRALCFALAGGACVATRIIGVAVFGLSGVAVAVCLAARGSLNRRTLGLGLVAAAGAYLSYLVLTPAMLADPSGFVEYLVKNAVGFSRWHGSLLFFGEVIDCSVTKPPRIYLPAMIAVTTPLWALLALAAGCIFGAGRLRLLRRMALCDERNVLLVCAALLWILPLVGCFALRVLVYNGWRHVYFTYGFMAIGMGYGFERLWRWTAGKRKWRAALSAALSVSLLVSAVGIGISHPYQYGYYNALVPGANRAQRFDMDYWNLSCVDALQKLLDVTQGEVRVAAADRYTQSGLSMSASYIGSERLIALKGENALDEADYALSNLSYTAIYGTASTEGWTEVATVYSYGCPITVIYALPKGGTV